MRKHHVTKKILCLFLSLLMVVSTFAVTMIPASAAKIDRTKADVNHDIAVVFDNSGSMYLNKSWSQAKYAMEIFASMLDYDTDTLSIFPMWEVTTDGSKPAIGGGSYERIVIDGKDDIDKIHNLFTVNPSVTPYAPIKEAHNYLKGLGDKDSEKWLIVLTDGKFDSEDRNSSDKANIDLQDRLPKLASDEIQVQYLGIGSAQELKTDSKHPNFHAKKSTSESLKTDLVDICNSIFQRSVLPSTKLNGKTLKLDMSMGKLIVFVQGEGAKIDSLTNSKGKKVKEVLNSGQRTYSTITANDAKNPYSKAETDTSLAGQVVTFDACEAGTYTLNYSGTKNIQIFYEPDIDIAFTLKDSKGKVVDYKKQTITTGDYTIDFTLVDRITGKDVLKDNDARKLLEPVDISATIEYPNDSEKTLVGVKSGSKIKLEPGDDVFFNITAKYLNKFTITTDSQRDAYTFTIKNPAVAEIKVKMTCLQDSNWYQLKYEDEWQPIVAEITRDGKKLTDEQLKNIAFSVESSKDMIYSYKLIPGESAYEIYVGKDDKGNYTAPEIGVHKLTASAKMTDKYGQVSEDSDSSTFEVQNYNKIWRWLIYVLIALVILLLFLFFMSRKVLPKKLEIEKHDFYLRGRRIGGGERIYDRKGKTLTVKSMRVPSDFEAECSATFKLYPVDRRWTKSKRRKFGICDITNASIGVTRIKLDGGTTFEKKNGKFVSKMSPDEPIREETKSPMIKIESKRSSYLDITFYQK